MIFICYYRHYFNERLVLPTKPYCLYVIDGRFFHGYKEENNNNNNNDNNSNYCYYYYYYG